MLVILFVLVKKRGQAAARSRDLTHPSYPMYPTYRLGSYHRNPSAFV